MKFLNYESKPSQLIIKLCYSCLLNLLWAVCSLPVFTIGASTTALWYASLKVIRGQEYNAGALFFRSFKQNFKQATQLWLILLTAGLFLGGDIWILLHLRANTTGASAVFWTLLLALVIAASVVYVIILLWVFPLLASVDNTNIAMLKNSFLIGTHYLFATILMFAVHFAMAYVIISLFTPMFLMGEGLCVLICAWLINRVLRSVSYDPDESRGSETEEADV